MGAARRVYVLYHELIMDIFYLSIREKNLRANYLLDVTRVGIFSNDCRKGLEEERSRIDDS